MMKTVPSQRERPETSGAAYKEQHRLRLEFLNALHVAFKGARYFPPQNESVIRKIDRLFQLIRTLFSTEGACNLEHVHSFLMLNGSRLKTDVAGLTPYNFMMERMSKLRIGAISFQETITLDDLRSFLYIFAKIDPKDSGDDPFRTFNEDIKRHGLSCVSLSPEDQQGLCTRSQNLRTKSVDIYFRSISVAKSVLQNAHAGKSVNFRHAKRAVQSMVDIAAEDEFFLVALSSIKNYDEYTYNHSTNVAVVSVTFGQHLGLDKELLGSLGMAALLHDIGKTYIDKEILNKPGKLNLAEWEMIRSHPLLGVQTLLRSSEMNELLIRTIIVTFQHHMRVDLQGYPPSKSDGELSLFSKIVAIGDCYDALTTPRVYRERSYSAAEALAIMLQDAGTVFDPLLVRRFALFLTLYPVGTMVRLDTGESGLVCGVHRDVDLLDRPTLKIVADADGNRIAPVVADLTEKNPDGSYKRNIVAITAPSDYFRNLEEYFSLL